MTCRLCHRELALEAFRLPAGKRSRRTECRECERADSLGRSRANAQDRRDRARRYHASHREGRKAYALANRDRRRVQERRRRAEHHDEHRAIENARRRSMTSEQREARADRWRAYFASYHARRYAEDPDYRARQIEAARERRRLKPELHRQAQRRRRARKAGAIVEPVDRARVVARDDSTCYLCHCRLEPDAITLDHVIPLVRGGAHSEANLRVACRSCNARKGTRLLSEMAA